MKAILLTTILATLALAGCTATDESADGRDGSSTTTTEGGGGQVEGQVTVVEGNSSRSTNSTNGTNTTG